MTEQKHEMNVIRDLIYFDIAKAESILSQLEGGLVSEIESSTNTETEEKNLRNYDVKIFKPEFGSIQTESEGTIERRRRHHEMISILESELLHEGFGLDINLFINPTDAAEGIAHKTLRDYGYAKASGWVLLEDYSRLQFILNRYNSIIDFINTSQREDLPELRSLQELIKIKEIEISNIKDRNKKVKPKRRLDELNTQLQEIIDKQSDSNKLEEWQTEGINNFIETFLQDRLSLFLFPFDEYLPFHILSSLKRSCFVDTDVDSFIYSYGTRPNLKLTILGLITSLPDPDIEIPNFNNRFEETDLQIANQIVLEKAFANIFDKLLDVDKYFSFSHFPNVTLYPIAIYREITNENPSENT